MTEQVRHIDIAADDRSARGHLAAREDAIDAGESLAPLAQGRFANGGAAYQIAESWYPRLHFGWSELRSARVGEWKFIAAPKPELYDLRVDRAEAKNVAAATVRQVAGRLAADLSRVTDRFGQTPPTCKASSRTRQPFERLQALGYLGSFAPVTGAGTGDDPKTTSSNIASTGSPSIARCCCWEREASPKQRPRCSES